MVIKKMVPYEAFAFRCGAGDVVLRESYKPKTYGKLYYTCPRSKKEKRVRLLVNSPGASTNPIYSLGSSMIPGYSPGPLTPPSYSLRPSRNAECTNCKLFIRKLQSEDWVEMLVLYCWRSVDKDFMVAGVINKLCEEVAAANEETDYFIQELDVFPGWVVATQKTSEFLKETQKKDDERLRQPEPLSRETEAKAREKCIFIKKLKGIQPF
uniref:Uncharacterized protein n=1 Tax=Tanacetum cinerariifolium TaxID=118510 RepID=A0A6L2JIT1_TANCI|nr:hypothetical protein [Tanacetum cinerariifolium]